MKKNIFLLAIGLTLILSGCSQQSSGVKTEDEIRAEVQAELEAEEKLKEELRAEIEAEMADEAASDAEAPEPADSDSDPGDTPVKVPDAGPVDGEKPDGAQVIEASALVEGMTIEGYVIKDLEYIRNTELSYVLQGEFQLEGVLYNDMLWDEPRFEPGEGHYLETRISFMEETLIDLPSKYAYLGQYSDLAAFISSDQIDRIKSGEVLPARLVARNNLLVLRDGTEGHAGYETILSLEILEGDPGDGSSESGADEPGAGTDSQEESGFAPEELSGTWIDYSKYHTVVIPMRESVNAPLLARPTASFSDNPENIRVRFTVLGEMTDVRLSYFESMGSEAEIIEMGTLNDCIVEVYAPFGTDFSTVKVEGLVRTMEENKIDFNLDDLRDDSEYEIILIQ
jgi:hypothetical protein